MYRLQNSDISQAKRGKGDQKTRVKFFRKAISHPSTQSLIRSTRRIHETLKSQKRYESPEGPELHGP